MHRRGAPNKKSTQPYAECCRLIRQTVSVACNRCDYELGMVRSEIHTPKNFLFSCCLSFTSKEYRFSTRCMHGFMIASGMPRFCHTPACKIKESLIELKRVTNSKTGELEESYILSDFYLSREFSDGELRLLIDSLLFFQHIPYSRCRSW